MKDQFENVDMDDLSFFWRKIKSFQKLFAQSAGAVEYTDCFPAES